MVQVLKPAMRERIEQAALRCFAEDGYDGTSMAQISAAAGTAPANVYRYFASKRALFDAVVPADLAAEHDRLLDSRVQALGQGSGSSSPAASQLLAFWLKHRLAIVVLLDRAAGTPFAAYPASFVARLVGHAQRHLPHPAGPEQEQVLELVFDNTRRAIARILSAAEDDEQARRLVEAFWCYQVPGLDGLMSYLRSADAHSAGDRSPPPAERDRSAARDDTNVSRKYLHRTQPASPAEPLHDST
jgi:AcrR family transcriptional regulator